MQLEKCWKCDSILVDLDHRDLISFSPYVKCLVCDNTGPSVVSKSSRSRDCMEATKDAVEAWNKACLMNKTKLGKLLSSDE